VAVADHVVLGARASAVDRRGPVFVPLFGSHMRAINDSSRPVELLGVLQLIQEHLVHAFHTPASFQSCNRRQEVIPDPGPIAWGRCSHGTPVSRQTGCPSTLPSRAGTCGPDTDTRLHTGKSGSIRSHSSSLTNGFAIDTPSTRTASHHLLLLGALRTSDEPDQAASIAALISGRRLLPKAAVLGSASYLPALDKSAATNSSRQANTSPLAQEQIAPKLHQAQSQPQERTRSL